MRKLLVLAIALLTVVGCAHPSQVTPPAAGPKFGAWAAPMGPNVTLAGAGMTYGGGTGVVAVANASVAPASTCGSGGCLYESAGTLIHIGSGGAFWGVAPAGVNAKNTQSNIWYVSTWNTHSTSNTAQNVFQSQAVPTGGVLTLDMTVQARDTVAPASSAESKLICSFYNSAGTVTQLGSATVLYNHGFTAVPTCLISGTSINLKATPNTANATDIQAEVFVSVD